MMTKIVVLVHLLAMSAIMAMASEPSSSSSSELKKVEGGGGGESKRSYMRACYFTSWSRYRLGQGRYDPSDYVPKLCTHIIYAFAIFNNITYEIENSDQTDVAVPWRPIGTYEQVNRLKIDDPELKTLLCIGGSSFGIELFRSMTSARERRQQFINSTLLFVRKHNFDGVDIDWEFPVTDADKLAFSHLLQEMRNEIDAESQLTGRERLLLTVAVSPGEHIVTKGYDIPVIGKNVDYILLMSYDFNGPWHNYTGSHTALSLIAGGENYNTEWATLYWTSNGAPKEKLIIGLASYARGWKLDNATNDYGIGAFAIGQSDPTDIVRIGGVAAYYEICDMLGDGAKRYWDGDQQAPYCIYGDQWFSYDDPISMRAKLRWLKSKGYGGAFIWTLDFDDFLGNCTANLINRRYPLITVMQQELS